MNHVVPSLWLCVLHTHTLTHTLSDSFNLRQKMPILPHTYKNKEISPPKNLHVASPLTQQLSLCPVSASFHWTATVSYGPKIKMHTNAKWRVGAKHKTNRCAFTLRFSDGTFSTWALARACRTETESVSVWLVETFVYICGGSVKPGSLLRDTSPLVPPASGEFT